MVGKFVIIILIIFYSNPINSGAKQVGKKKDYTRQQKIWQGKIKEKKYTTCRLKKRVTSKYTKKKACIYQGGNKTYTMMIETWCPTKYKCEITKLSSEMPNIDSVMESLRSIKD